MKPTVMVTGANRGIGLEYVTQYAEHTSNLIATYRELSRSQRLEDLSTRYEQVRLMPLDMASETEISRTAEILRSTPIDILILNAGIYHHEDGVSGLGAEDLMHLFQINTIAPLMLAKALLGSMVMSQLKTIVYMSSIMGSVSLNDKAHVSKVNYCYRASKAAGNSLMRSLSIEAAVKGVKVLILHPGWVKTDMGGQEADLDVTQSVSGMRKVIANPESESGVFYSYDGRILPW